MDAGGIITANVIAQTVVRRSRDSELSGLISSRIS